MTTLHRSYVETRTLGLSALSYKKAGEDKISFFYFPGIKILGYTKEFICVAKDVASEYYYMRYSGKMPSIADCNIIESCLALNPDFTLVLFLRGDEGVVEFPVYAKNIAGQIAFSKDLYVDLDKEKRSMIINYRASDKDSSGYIIEYFDRIYYLDADELKLALSIYLIGDVWMEIGETDSSSEFPDACLLEILDGVTCQTFNIESANVLPTYAGNFSVGKLKIKDFINKPKVSIFATPLPLLAEPQQLKPVEKLKETPKELPKEKVAQTASSILAPLEIPFSFYLDKQGKLVGQYYEITDYQEIEDPDHIKLGTYIDSVFYQNSKLYVETTNKEKAKKQFADIFKLDVVILESKE